MIESLLTGLALLLSSSASALNNGYNPSLVGTHGCVSGGTCYYVDYDNGNDGNDGLAKTPGGGHGPWKSMPGMRCATGQAAAHAFTQTDEFILKGGVSWPFSCLYNNSKRSWTIDGGGAGTPNSYAYPGMYIGYDPAWNAGKVNHVVITNPGVCAHGTTLSVGFSGGGGTGAAGTATLSRADPDFANDTLNWVAITNRGSGYTANPTVNLSIASGSCATLPQATADIYAPIMDGSGGLFGDGTQNEQRMLTVGGSARRITIDHLDFGHYKFNTGECRWGTNQLGVFAQNAVLRNLFVHDWTAQSLPGYTGNCNDSNSTMLYGADDPNGDTLDNSVINNYESSAMGCTNYYAEMCGQGTAINHVQYVTNNIVSGMRGGIYAISPTPNYVVAGNLVYDILHDANTQHEDSTYLHSGGLFYNNIIRDFYSGAPGFYAELDNNDKGMTSYFFNNVLWNVGWAAFAWSAEFAGTSISGSPDFRSYNNTVLAQTGSYACMGAGQWYGSSPQLSLNPGFFFTLANNHCISSQQIEHWYNVDDAGGQCPNGCGIWNGQQQPNSAATRALIDPTAVVQSPQVAGNDGYDAAHGYSPTSGSAKTVAFASDPHSANLTSLCGNVVGGNSLAPLCQDINGNLRPASGGWQAGAYSYTGGIPAITSPGTTNGTVGQAFNYQITATNNPTSFGASGLPNGLSVNTNSGVISGTPTVAGMSTATISASNAYGTGTLPLVITINNLSTSDIYISQNGSGDGSSCSSPKSASFFNNASNWGTGTGKIGPGVTVHLCGTFTAGVGQTMLAFQGNGAAGNPITLLFEPNAVVQSPAFPDSGGGTGCGAGICLYGRSYVTIDGGSNGTIQNTDNGDLLGHDLASTLIDGYSCNNCTIKNLRMLNTYVKVKNGGNAAPGDQQHSNTMSGSHWSFHDNVIDNCGWCVFQHFANGDTDAQIYNNKISNFGHALMLATAGVNRFTNYYLHDNDIHDADNWSTPACDYHNDGLHTFTTGGGSMDGLYLSNNYFHGNWGNCATGFIFIEAGGFSPSHASNIYYWNNVHLVPPGAEVNTNSWIGLFDGEEGVTQVFNNTIIGPNATDNTQCFGITAKNLSFEDNVISNCGDPVGINNSSIVALDRNFYGPSCQNGNNCFIWNGAFTGSFSAWKAASGGDQNSVQGNTPRLNPDGSPQSGSPVIGLGANLTGLATGSLASLAKDTTLGNTRVPLARPGSGSWDAGAYSFSNSSGTDTTPPTISSVAASNVGLSSATIAWTTNEPSDSQIDYGTTTAYGASSALNPAMVTSHSVGLSGLLASTQYHYRVKSRDAAGNLAVSGDNVFTTKTPDIIPPTVAVSSPADGAIVGGAVMIVASVSDNIGVASVQFQVDGANFGQPVTLPPYQVVWNTSGLPNGSKHALTAIAADAAGNKSSASVNVTVRRSIAVNADVPGLRDAFAYPNPAVRKDPTLRAALGLVDSVEISIYDAAGRLVHSATLPGQPTGVNDGGEYYYDYAWSGRTASGTYFAVLHGKKSDGTVVRARIPFALVR